MPAPEATSRLNATESALWPTDLVSVLFHKRKCSFVAHLLLVTLCDCTARRTNAHDFLQASMLNNCTLGPRTPASSLYGFVHLPYILLLGFCPVFDLSILPQPGKRLSKPNTTQNSIILWGRTLTSFWDPCQTFRYIQLLPVKKTCKERSQYTREQAWENLKEDVKHLYVTQRLDLKEVQACLRSQGKYNSEAT